MLPCGKSLTALNRFKQSPLKFGVILALAAWLVQLSVFLTPIFAKQIGVGFGVCEELSVFSPVSTTSQPYTVKSSPPSSVHPHDEMAGMSMADMPDMAMQGMPAQANHPHQHVSQTTKPSSAPTSQLATHVDSHHQDHAKCSFCLLLGHSVLPPFYAAEPLLLSLAIATFQVAVKAADDAFLKHNKNLRPQGRAPPAFAV